VLLAAIGFSTLTEIVNKKLFGWLVPAIVIILAIHPVMFLTKKPVYSYLYYNQFVGGLKGAYGNYETDYYYVSQTEASEWLIEYLKKQNIDSAIVMTTSPDNWHFRKNPAIRPLYIRYEERSMREWDYAIVSNRYIHPHKLKNKTWPPKNSIHIIYVDSIPVGAVLKRSEKSDYKGFIALENGRISDAIKFFEEALLTDNADEMIFYNFARALYNDGQYQKADSVLKAGLEINPDFDLILMYLGNIASFKNNSGEALEYYERVILANRKYLQAYVESAKLLYENDLDKARILLRECLKINPKFKPAIAGLADTYRLTDPEIAKKYDEIAATIK
jgi:tetratricopeptide (TPR) repeat protein